MKLANYFNNLMNSRFSEILHNNKYFTFIIIVLIILAFYYLKNYYNTEDKNDNQANEEANEEANNDENNKESKQQNNEGFFQYSTFTNYMPFTTQSSIQEGLQNFEPHINRLIMQKIKEAEAEEPNYDCQSYLDRYPDLKKAFGESCTNIQTRMRAIGHWIQYGKNEKRNPTSIEKLSDLQKEKLQQKRNEQLQLELINEIAKLQARHDKEHREEKDKDYRLEEKKKLCQSRMSRAVSSMRIAENKMDIARIQANRTRRICRKAPGPIIQKKIIKKEEPLKDTTIFVGNSGQNSKTIEIPMGIKEVDTNYINTWGGRPCNGPNSCGVGDRFNAEIYTSGGKQYLKTTRLDSGGGWGMQVKFKAKTT